MMRIHRQQKEYPEFWIGESITQLIEEDLDHPTTSQYFMDQTLINQRTSKHKNKKFPAKYLQISYQRI